MYSLYLLTVYSVFTMNIQLLYTYFKLNVLIFFDLFEIIVTVDFVSKFGKIACRAFGKDDAEC